MQKPGHNGLVFALFLQQAIFFFYFILRLNITNYKIYFSTIPQSQHLDKNERQHLMHAGKKKDRNNQTSLSINAIKTLEIL